MVRSSSELPGGKMGCAGKTWWASCSAATASRYFYPPLCTQEHTALSICYTKIQPFECSRTGAWINPYFFIVLIDLDETLSAELLPVEAERVWVSLENKPWIWANAFSSVLSSSVIFWWHTHFESRKMILVFIVYGIPGECAILNNNSIMFSLLNFSITWRSYWRSFGCKMKADTGFINCRGNKVESNWCSNSA